MSLTPTALLLLSVQAADWKATHMSGKWRGSGHTRLTRSMPGTS